MKRSWIHTHTQAGQPVSSGETHVMPVARSVRLQPPGWQAGLIWNRPLAVVVRTADGRVNAIPVHDVTRRRQLLWFVVGLLGSIIIWWVFRK